MSFDKNDALERKLCFGFQTGSCKAVGGKCPNGYVHQLAKKKRAPTPPAKGRGKGDTSKTPCSFFAKGACIWGDEYSFSHGNNQPPKDTPKAADEVKGV